MRIMKEKETKVANCKWCTKEGVVDFTLFELSGNPKMDIMTANDIMTKNFSERMLIEVTDGIYACKECVRHYNLRSTTTLQS